MPRFPTTYDDLPATPPPEVLREVEVAWIRAQELFSTQIDLAFALDDERRVWVDLTLPDGSLVGRLNAREALALACGHPSDELLAG